MILVWQTLMIYKLSHYIDDFTGINNKSNRLCLNFIYSINFYDIKIHAPRQLQTIKVLI